MPDPIICVYRPETRQCKSADFKIAMRGLLASVEANEPRIIACNVLFTEDRTGMTVIHIHPDPVSLACHMKVAGPAFPKLRT